jgi:hypothetical protein
VAAPQQDQVPPVDHIQQTGLIAAPNQITHQFEFAYTSKIDGETYSGRFAVKKLSIKDLGQLGVRKAQLNGGLYHDETKPGSGIDAETDWINTMIAHLELAIIQQPDWYNLDLVYDAHLLGELYKKVAEFENAFFRAGRDRNDGPGRSQDAGSSEGEESGSAGHVEAVGRGEVPAAMEP